MAAKKSTAKKKPKAPSVKIYTTSSCPWCMKTKEFLREQNVKYTEINVSENEKARNDMFNKSGQFGVPVTDINGKIIVGFDREGLKKALKM